MGLFDDFKSAVMEAALNNPKTAAVVVVGASVAAAPAMITTPFLAIAGFAPSVGLGTLAAVIQGGIGNVVAGSPFAIVQSAGAGGAGLAIVNGGVSAGGAVVAGAGLVGAAAKKFLG